VSMRQRHLLAGALMVILAFTVLGIVNGWM
jgi:hypothetical protein